MNLQIYCNMCNAVKNFYIENVKLRMLGDTSELSERLQSRINAMYEKTKDYTGLVLNIAFNYGGRQEIFDQYDKIMIEGY